MAKLVVIEKFKDFDYAASRASDLAMTYNEQTVVRSVANGWVVLASTEVHEALVEEEKAHREWWARTYWTEFGYVDDEDGRRRLHEHRSGGNEYFYLDRKYPEPQMSSSEWQRELERHHVVYEEEPSHVMQTCSNPFCQDASCTDPNCRTGSFF